VTVSRVGGAATSREESARQDDYFDAVATWLYRMWSQPDRAEVGAGRRVTVVEISVNSEGLVRSARIVAPSRNAAMDASVAALVRSLRRLPPPSEHGVRARSLTFRVRFELEE